MEEVWDHGTVEVLVCRRLVVEGLVHGTVEVLVCHHLVEEGLVHGTVEVLVCHHLVEDHRQGEAIRHLHQQDHLHQQVRHHQLRHFSMARLVQKSDVPVPIY